VPKSAFRKPIVTRSAVTAARLSGSIILVLVVACSGASGDSTSTSAAAGSASTTTPSDSTLVTSTTAAASSLEVTAEVVCYSSGSDPDQHDVTITVTGDPGNTFNGVFAWGGGAVDLFDGVFDSLPSQFSFSKTIAGPGRVVVSDNSGGRVEIAVRAGACETVVPDTVLEVEAFTFCFDGAEPVVEYTVTASPGIGAGGDVTVFVTALNGDLIYAETFDGPMAEGSGGIGLGTRTGQITVNAVSSSGVSSPISFQTIPECTQALRIITAEATCISADAWELRLEVEGEPGLAGNYFYSWDGSTDGEVGEFLIGPDGFWQEALFWPGNVEGQVSLASFEDEGFGPVDVVILDCG